jgi:hypothetical protein
VQETGHHKNKTPDPSTLLGLEANVHAHPICNFMFARNKSTVPSAGFHETGQYSAALCAVTLHQFCPSRRASVKCEFKFLYATKRSMVFTPPLFTIVAANSYTSWTSLVRKVLQIGLKTYKLRGKFHFSRNLPLTRWF